MIIATTVGLTAINLIAGGFLLGIGFWGSKKLTTYLDVRLALRNSKIKQLTKEFPYGVSIPAA